LKKAMRYNILLITFFCYLTATSQTPACSTGSMKPAKNEHGLDVPVPPIKGLTDDFLIVVDPTINATNFISWTEDYLRGESIHPDTFSSFIIPTNLPVKLTIASL